MATRVCNELIRYILYLYTFASKARVARKEFYDPQEEYLYLLLGFLAKRLLGFHFKATSPGACFERPMEYHANYIHYEFTFSV